MIDLISFRKLSFYSNFGTRSLNVLELMEGIFGPPSINPVNIEDSLFNENWPRFNVISDDNFTVNSPRVPCILYNVDVKPTSVIQLFCDHSNLTWDHVNNIPSRALTGITKGPQYAVTRQFVNSIQAEMNFNHGISPYCFIDQKDTSCMGLLLNGPWFNYAHTETGGGASSALLNQGVKIWCASTSSSGIRLFERFCHSPEGLIDLMQRGPREREARFLKFTLQSPGDLIYIPQLLAHAVLTLDTSSPTIFSMSFDAFYVLALFSVRFSIWRENQPPACVCLANFSKLYYFGKLTKLQKCAILNLDFFTNHFPVNLL